jgi:hypothetical protein
MADATLPPLVEYPRAEGGPRNGAAFTSATRGLLIVLGLLLAGLLIIARCLVPDPSGLGTHEQLGLKPCWTLRLWQTRCPSCGMTTAWSHAVRGEFANAARVNLGGASLCLLAAIATPWMLGSGLCGRWIAWQPTEMVLLSIAVAVVFVTLLEYLVRINLVDRF